MTTDISPLAMARAACATASRLEPHKRLTVDPGHFLGQPGEEERHAADVPVVFARLVRAPEYHVVYSRDVEPWVARAKLSDGDGRKVVGPNARQGTAVAAKGGADGVADDRRVS